MQKSTFYSLLIIVSLIVGTIGCTLIDSEKKEQIPQNVELKPCKEDNCTFQFNIYEKLTKKSIGREFIISGLYCDFNRRPHGAFRDPNKKKEYTFSFEGKKLIFNIKKISLSPLKNCRSHSKRSRLSETVNLEEGIYSLELHSNYVIDSYSIKVTKEQVKLYAIQNNFTNTTHIAFDRHPDNLVWTHCYYSGDYRKDPKSDFCDRFFAEIETFAMPYPEKRGTKTPHVQMYLYNGNNKKWEELMLKYNKDNYYVRILTWEGYSCSKGECHFQYHLVPKIENKYPRTPNTNVALCYKEKNELKLLQCLKIAAVYGKNETACQLLPKKERTHCYISVGMVKQDLNLCERAESDSKLKRECIEYLNSLGIKEPAVKDTPSFMALATQVIGKSSNTTKGMDHVIITIEINRGHVPIDLNIDSAEFLYSYKEGNVRRKNIYTPTSKISFIGANNNDKMLDPGEKALIELDLPVSVKAGNRFDIQILPEYGRTLDIEMITPEVIEEHMNNLLLEEYSFNE